MSDMVCELCRYSGILSGGRDVMGMPSGWVQRCDLCEKLPDDLAAMNAHRLRLGHKPMQGYPFSIVERGDAGPDHPLEQTFFVRWEFKERKLEAAVTLRVERDMSVQDFEIAIRVGAIDWMRESGEVDRSFPTHVMHLKELVVYDCLPLNENPT